MWTLIVILAMISISVKKDDKFVWEDFDEFGSSELFKEKLLNEKTRI
jgi:hypothetical protein